MSEVGLGLVGLFPAAGTYCRTAAVPQMESKDHDEQSDSDNEGGVQLSEETLRALREFALDAGVFVDSNKIIESVRDHFEEKDREDVFKISYKSKDNQREVNFNLKGIKRELGQTLDSTGLTIWRAAEHLCQFIIDNPSTFKDKKICELGAGLGLVAVLLEKLEYTSPSSLVITDGDEPTMELLIDNKVDNECFFETSYLYWGLCEDFQSSYPDKFEIVIAADVIYEDAQVEPLLDTVCAIMQATGQFILAFARRNVSIDKVHRAAEARGLQWTIIDDSPEGVSGVEPIYSFTWKK